MVDDGVGPVEVASVAISLLRDEQEVLVVSDLEAVGGGAKAHLHDELADLELLMVQDGLGALEDIVVDGQANLSWKRGEKERSLRLSSSVSHAEHALGG